ncbi:MAG: YihY/virulence factor BrkB family protein [Gammaproteobacteria bacterium]|nr:YihY/virulence factor BrkB family protein [Gammaproteobacteria bacterium]
MISETRARPWRRVLERTQRQMLQHNSGLLAGGVAMYGLLSVFPGLAASVLIYGLFATPIEVAQHMRFFAGILPPGAWSIFNTQLQAVAAHDHRTLTAAAVLSVLVALWSARLTMSGLMTATNIAHGIEDERGYIGHTLVSLLLTLAAVLGFLAMLVLGVVVPLALALLGTDLWVKAALAVIRWVVLWGFAVVGVALVYHYAPARRRQTWRCLTPGSVLAASLWLAVSGLFTAYVRMFDSYDATYGALAGVIVLLMWFYLLSFSVLLGAELNAAIRHIDRGDP